MAILERKYLAHFIDANMVHDLNSSGLPSGSTNYVRIGKHLESYREDMNPQIEQHQNIIGESVVLHSGYQPSGSVDTFFAEPENDLYKAIEEIAVERLCGDDTRTTCVDAMISVGTEASVEWAYKEDCYIAVQSFGGDTKGVQVPFQIIKAGNRRKVNFYKSGERWYISGLA